MPGEQTDALAPLTVFYSYAHEDERLRKKLEKHLSLLRQQGLITEWHDRIVAVVAAEHDHDRRRRDDRQGLAPRR